MLAKASPLSRPILKNPQLGADVDEVVGMIAGDRVYRFQRPLDVDTGRTGGMVTFECPRLSVLGYGKGQGEAWDQFVRAFDVQYRFVMETPEGELHPSALRVKKAMRRLVEAVEYAL